MVFTWSRTGGYEVSSSGDARFSALYAICPSAHESIESLYQKNVKGYRSIKEGKGKPPLNPEVDLWHEYLGLWRHWADYNEELLEELAMFAGAHGGVLSDRYATSKNNQAHALATILNERPYLHRRLQSEIQ